MSDAVVPTSAPSQLLGTVFRISLYGLTALASIALAIGDDTLFPVVLTPAMCLAAYFFNERQPLVQLSANWGNALGFVALCVMGIEFWNQELLGRLLAGAHLLVYLTWIVLFQKKTITLYWMLLALGLLQVAVGAVLTVSGWFGLLLFLYMLLAVWTISVFSLYQGEMRFAGEARGSTLLVEGTTRRSVIRNSVQLDPTESWLSPRFVFGIFSVAGTGIVVGAVFFLLVPRMWVGGINVFARDASGPLGGRALTGFREEVTLADMGTLLDSPNPVLRIRATNNDTGLPANLQAWADEAGLDDLLFRGAVFDTYSRDSSNNGRWAAEARSSVHQVKEMPQRHALRLNIVQEPIGTDIVFPIWPLSAAAWDREPRRVTKFRRTHSDVLYLADRPGAQFEYRIYLPAHRPETRWAGLSRLRSHDARARYLRIPDHLERLRQLALQIVRNRNLPGRSEDPPHYRQALALDAHLRLSGEYAYTRETTPSDPGIDPIEDFLFNRKAGHCQYYAAALTIMLRSAGIPARMVNGFKGAETGREPGQYIVQQRHAHAWVEAWIDANPREPLLDGEWITLDPTPAGRDLSLAQSYGDNATAWTTFRDTTNNIWNNYVVGLTIDRQVDSFFGPLQRLAVLVGGLFSENGLLALPRWFWLLLTTPELWFTWQGGATALGLLAAVWGSYFLLRSLARLARRTRVAGRRGQTVRVEFYERFAGLLARRGLTRRDDQTAREFSTLAGRVLHPELSASGLTTTFPQLVDAYHRVRYGASPLVPEELATLHGQLDRLEAALKNGR